MCGGGGLLTVGCQVETLVQGPPADSARAAGSHRPTPECALLYVPQFLGPAFPMPLLCVEARAECCLTLGECNPTGIVPPLLGPWGRAVL